MDSAELFAANLKKLRKRKGLTQEQLAKAAGVSTQSIKDFEKPRYHPKIETAEALAKALEVAVSDLYIADAAGGPPRATPDEYPLDLFIAERERLGVPLTTDEVGGLREFRFRGKAKSADDWVKILKFLPTIGR